jgi:hypothetical protein
MNTQVLKNELQLLNVPENSYSLDGYLKIDAIILFPKDEKWEVFYVDERYGKHDEKIFYAESDACKDVLERFRDLIETAKQHGIRGL